MFLLNAGPRTPFDSGSITFGLAAVMLAWNVLACVHWQSLPLRPGQKAPGAMSLLAFSIVCAVSFEIFVVFSGFPFMLLVGPLFLGVSAAWATIRGVHARLKLHSVRH